MDANCSMPIMKKQKFIGEYETQNEDRISQLPENILHRILSLLPTKEAVATCTLATRWQTLWMSITNLDFICYARYLREEKWNNSFTRFVERVLLFHSSNIKMFCLSSGCLDGARVNAWISAAVRRQVQELHLSLIIENGGVLVLPTCLCTSRMLTVLKVHVWCELKLPANICFSSLKTLYLRYVKFYDDASVSKLFSSLQVLEELKLVTCNWQNINTATISIPSLRSLTLDFGTSMNGRQTHCKLMVYGENISYLDCTSNHTVDLLLDNVPLLVEANILLTTLCRAEASLTVTKVFSGIRFAKTLRLSDMNIQFATPTETINVFPTFENLTYLELISEMNNGNNEPLMGVLQNSPILESIVLPSVFDAGHRVDVAASWRSYPVPQCFKCSLTSCCLKEFEGNKDEMDLIRFLLETTCVLKNMKIYCRYSMTVKKKQKLAMHLEMAPRKSKTCVVEIFEPGEV